jgi:Tol biopolymer transport system component
MWGFPIFDFRFQIGDLWLFDDYNSSTCIITCMVLKTLRFITFLPLFTFIFLSSCSSTPISTAQPSLYIYRFSPPAFVQLSNDFQPVKDFPFSIPSDCSLLDVFPPPTGNLLLVELSCPNGQTVLLLDTDSGSVTQPVPETDSHFLAWTTDGKNAYLKVDTLGNTRIVSSDKKGKLKKVDITGWTYDLSMMPGSSGFVFTFSRGLGSGSEMTLSQQNGRDFQQLLADHFNYLSFARYSPDGKQIAFIKIPDSQTPFTVGELWVVDADGSNAHKVADADAGHGYAANWSPDGKSIAFVKRENPELESADQSAESLVSNIYLINVQSGELKQITSFKNGRAETPHWSPDGNTLSFNAVLDGRMEVQSADIVSGEIRSLTTEPACCPAWVRK